MSSSQLFAGAASYYSRYRPPYPEQIFRRVVDAFGLDGSGRLLDVGCGPGAFTFPLQPYFEEVVAIDASPDMIREAEVQARLRGVTRIGWLVMDAEEISPALGSFRLISIASAFHWMNRDLVLGRCREVLDDDGGLVLSGGLCSWWESTVPWHQVVIKVIKAWLGPERRTASGPYKTVPYERFEAALTRSNFEVFEQDEVSLTHAWDIDSIVGYLYSTSFANQPLFGPKLGAFEEELRETLLELSPSGHFQEEITFDYILARKAN